MRIIWPYKSNDADSRYFIEEVRGSYTPIWIEVERDSIRAMLDEIDTLKKVINNE